MEILSKTKQLWHKMWNYDVKLENYGIILVTVT